MIQLGLYLKCSGMSLNLKVHEMVYMISMVYFDVLFSILDHVLNFKRQYVISFMG